MFASGDDDVATRDALKLVTHVAHDLRSPLTSILFLTDALQSGESGPLSATQTQQLALIYSAAFQLSSLVDDLTQYARTGEEFLESVSVPFLIGDVFKSVRDIVRPIAEEKKLELRFSSKIQDRRLGHPAALGRVVLNLVTNALKYTEQGWVEVLARERAGSSVEFSVADTGPGMPPNIVDAVVQPAERQSGGQTHRFLMSGLGLVICRRLIHAMGGELQIKAIPAEGTFISFVIDLPAAQASN